MVILWKKHQLRAVHQDTARESILLKQLNEESVSVAPVDKNKTLRASAAELSNDIFGKFTRTTVYYHM